MKKLFVIAVVVVAVFFTNMAVVTSSAIAQTIVKWRMISVWPAYSSIYQTQTRLAKSIYELSGGRMQISVHPAGELVPSAAVFDTVSKGAVEMGVDYPSYWAGKNSAFDLLGSYPMMLSQLDFIIWYIHGGGKNLINELYGKYNMVFFINGVTQGGSGIRSRMPINSLADLKGKKVRMVGKATGYVLQKLGAVQVMTSPAEVAQAMSVGAVDAVAFATHNIDWSMGLADVAKYCIGPSWHQSFNASGVIINKDAWDSLPPEFKKIIEAATMENTIYMTAIAQWDEIPYIDKFKDKGVKNTKFSEKDLKQVEEWVWEYIVEEAKNNPDYNKIVTSMLQYLKDYREVRYLQTPFAQGRNPSSFPNLPRLK